MENPNLYKSINVVQKCGAKSAIEKYKGIMTWCQNGDDTILDVGCGPGDTTFDYIVSILPDTFKKLDGIDIAQKMVDSANETYRHPKIQFKLMDILKVPNTPAEQYNHIFSFYCLNWIHNQELTLKNIYNLMTINGDCLMTIGTIVLIYEVFMLAKKSPKFSKYCYDAELFVSSYYHKKDPKNYIENMLHSIGFTGCLVDNMEKRFTFEAGFLRNFLYGIDPFVHRMPKDVQAEYMDFYLREYVKLQNVKYINDKQPLIFEYKYMVVYARK